jgi:hypothetical protein
MPYIAEKPNLVPPADFLRKAIVGWGVDLDRKSRPAIGTGAHWEFPERQIPNYRRERSTEHGMLTPVFGTVCPPKGLSGLIRRFAYRFSEARASHWLLLMLGDRVDVIESRFTALLRGRPDNLFAEAGLKAEFKRHGLRSRVGHHRADLKHLPIDVLIFTGSTLAAGAALFVLGRAATTLVTRARGR